MLATILLVVSILYFLIQGYRKGLYKFLFRLLGLVIAYVGTFFLAPIVAEKLNDGTGLNGLLGYIIAAISVFIVISMVADLLLSLLHKYWLKGQDKLSAINRFGGAAVGVVIGVFIGFLSIWFVSTLRQVITPQPYTEAELLKAGDDLNQLEKWSREFIASIVAGAVNATTDEPELANITSQLMRAPEVTIGHVRQLSNSSEFRELFLNPRNQAVLNRGDIDELINLPAFKQLLAQSNFQALQDNLLADANSTDVPRVLAEKVRDMWARAQFAQNDPTTQALLRDPELQQLLQSGQVLAVLNSEKLTQLFERLMSAEALNYSAQLKAQAVEHGLIETNEQTLKDSKVYRWVDDKGRVHYSDKPPEDQP